VLRASQAQSQLPQVALTRAERRERRVSARRRRAEFAKTRPLPRPGPADSAVARRVIVRSVEGCLPRPGREGKLRIVLAAHAAPLAPMDEKLIRLRVFQRHPRLSIAAQRPINTTADRMQKIGAKRCAERGDGLDRKRSCSYIMRVGCPDNAKVDAHDGHEQAPAVC
jgi:hypothetical protein